MKRGPPKIRQTGLICPKTNQQGDKVGSDWYRSVAPMRQYLSK